MAEVVIVVALVERLGASVKPVRLLCRGASWQGGNVRGVQGARKMTHDPTTVIELRRRIVEREVARAARKVALLRKECIVFACKPRSALYQLPRADNLSLP